VTDAAPVRKKRTGLRWLIALVVIAAILIAAFIVGDRIARDYAEGYIRDQVIAAFPGTDPTVTIADGSVLLQVVSGALDTVDIEMTDAAFGSITGDLSIAASDVPLDGTKPIDTVDIAFTMSEAQAQQILDGLDGFESATISLQDSEVGIASSFDVFGASIPLGLTLAPSVTDGTLVLTPATVSVNGAELSLTDLSSSPFGGIVTSLVKPQEVCVAQYLPSVLTLESATVVDGELTFGFSGSDVALATTDFEELGSC
jgi:hypothetical protein